MGFAVVLYIILFVCVDVFLCLLVCLVDVDGTGWFCCFVVSFCFCLGFILNWCLVVLGVLGYTLLINCYFDCLCYLFVFWFCLTVCNLVVIAYWCVVFGVLRWIWLFKDLLIVGWCVLLTTFRVDNSKVSLKLIEFVWNLLLVMLDLSVCLKCCWFVLLVDFGLLDLDVCVDLLWGVWTTIECGFTVVVDVDDDGFSCLSQFWVFVGLFVCNFGLLNLLSVCLMRLGLLWVWLRVWWAYGMCRIGYQGTWLFSIVWDCFWGTGLLRGVYELCCVFLFGFGFTRGY